MSLVGSAGRGVGSATSRRWATTRRSRGGSSRRAASTRTGSASAVRWAARSWVPAASTLAWAGESAPSARAVAVPVRAAEQARPVGTNCWRRRPWVEAGAQPAGGGPAWTPASAPAAPQASRSAGSWSQWPSRRSAAAAGPAPGRPGPRPPARAGPGRPGGRPPPSGPSPGRAWRSNGCSSPWRHLSTPTRTQAPTPSLGTTSRQTQHQGRDRQSCLAHTVREDGPPWPGWSPRSRLRPAPIPGCGHPRAPRLRVGQAPHQAHARSRAVQPVSSVEGNRHAR